MVCANSSYLFLFVQHKEPREVHMFVDLLLQEVILALSSFPVIRTGS